MSKYCLTVFDSSLTVSIKHGKSRGRGGTLVVCQDPDESSDARGWSKWSLASLDDELVGAIRRSIEARPAAFDKVFPDVDFTSDDGRTHLPDKDISYTTTTASTLFDNSVDGSPLVPWSNRHSSMLSFVTAAITSRRNAEHEALSGFSPKAHTEPPTEAPVEAFAMADADDEVVAASSSSDDPPGFSGRAGRGRRGPGEEAYQGVAELSRGPGAVAA